jgi:hypothetical protein
MKVNARGAVAPLDRFSAMPPRHERARPPPACTRKKSAQSTADGSARRPHRRKSRASAAAESLPAAPAPRRTSSICGERRWREARRITVRRSAASLRVLSFHERRRSAQRQRVAAAPLPGHPFSRHPSTRSPNVLSAARDSEAELCLDDVVDRLRVRLAA